MRALVLILPILMLVGCASPKKGIWVHKKGGESKQRAVANDTAVLKTAWGEIEVYPAEKHASFFEVEVIVRNTSSKPVNFKKSLVRIKNNQKEIISPLSDQEINAKLSHAAGFGAAAAGGIYAQTSGVTGALQSQYFGKMIKDEEIPADSVMKGFIFYPPEKVAGNFKFVVLKPLVKRTQALHFFEKSKPKRKPASKK